LLYKLLDLVPVLPVLPPKFVPVRVTELGKKLTFRVCAQVKLYDSNFTTCLRITNRSTLVCTVTPALPGYQHFDILTCSLLHIQPHIVSQMFGVLILTRVKILKTQHRPTHGYTYCTTVDMCTPLQYRRLHVRTASRQPPVPRYIINYR
jgi:hypothetical protein